MFTYLYFRMENSIGIPVSVALRNEDGIVHYGVSFKGSDSSPALTEHLSLANSAKLLKRIDQLGLVTVLPHFQELGLNEGGDFWQLHVEHMMGTIDLSGKRDSHSVIVPMMQDFAEILDDAFAVTQFISPNRLDRLEVELEFNEDDPEHKDSAEDYNALCHREIVVLDRQTNSIHYTKRFPARCARSNLQCHFDEEVRDVLDQTEHLFTESNLFEDIYDEKDLSPLLRFSFTYHDGTVIHVHRQQSADGLRDQIYMELLDVIYENLLNLLFKQSVFDKRMLLPKHLRKDFPFYVMYREGGFDDEEDSDLEGA